MKLGLRSLSALLGVLVLAALASPVASSAVCYSYKASETEFKKQTNQDRVNHGVAKLKIDPELSKVAHKRVKRLVRINALVHTSDISKNITHWRRLGENIGYDYSYSVTSLQNAFMDSPGHRANILDSRFRFLGVGTKEANGRLWVVVLFESRKNPGTTLQMPHC